MPQHLACPQGHHWEIRDPQTDPQAIYSNRCPICGTLADTLLLVLDAEPIAPRRLNPRVPRDLQTICLRCLEKRPGRRYPSATELADDLGRFLEGRPIRARPVGRLERLLKWTRRRPAQAALLAVCTFALLLGGAGVSRPLKLAQFLGMSPPGPYEPTREHDTTRPCQRPHRAADSQ
jgi:hypothetical protein